LKDGVRALREIERLLVGRALRDDEFRRRLVEDPKGALQSEIDRLGLQFHLPETMRVKVLEEEEDILYLILPPSLRRAEPPSDDLLLAAVKKVMQGEG